MKVSGGFLVSGLAIVTFVQTGLSCEVPLFGGVKGKPKGTPTILSWGGGSPIKTRLTQKVLEEVGPTEANMGNCCEDDQSIIDLWRTDRGAADVNGTDFSEFLYQKELGEPHPLCQHDFLSSWFMHVGLTER